MRGTERPGSGLIRANDGASSPPVKMCRQQRKFSARHGLGSSIKEACQFIRSMQQDPIMRYAVTILSILAVTGSAMAGGSIHLKTRLMDSSESAATEDRMQKRRNPGRSHFLLQFR